MTDCIKFLLFLFSTIITYYLTENKFNPILLYKKIARRINLKKSYIKKEKIVFSIPNYDFFDHEDKAYLSELIDIQFLDDKYLYNFGKTFEENCINFPKLQEIKSFITNNPDFKDLNIDEYIKKEILPTLDIKNDDANTYIVNKIIKNRRDEKLCPEAGTLKIEMIKTSLNTVILIDGLFKHLYKSNPEVMGTHFKRNILTDAECKDPHDIICFMTYLYTKGFVIEKNENNIHFLIHNENYFSYEIQLTEKQTDHVLNDNHINGDMLKKVIKDEIETAGITNTILNTKFTDIAISYLNGIHGEILGSVVVNNMKSPNNQFSIVPFTDDYCVFRSLLEKKENSDKKEFAYIYIWSIIRKAKYKHL